MLSRFRSPLSGLSLNRLAQIPAIHANVRARDKTGCSVTRQEYARADEFAGIAEAAHWRVSPNRLRPRSRRSVVVEQEFSILFCREETGRQRIYTHPSFRPLAG